MDELENKGRVASMTTSSKSRSMIHLTLVLGLLTCNASAQPIGYTVNWFVGNGEILKTDLNSNITSHFLTVDPRTNVVFWDIGEHWVFTLGGGYLVGTRTSDTTLTKTIALHVENAGIHASLQNPTRHLLWYVIDSAGAEFFRTVLLSDDSLLQIDSFTGDINNATRVFPSRSMDSLYVAVEDSSTGYRYIEGYSITSRLIGWRRRLFDIAAPTEVKSIEDARNGVALIGFNYPTSSNLDNQYVRYDPLTGTVSPACAFPFRSSRALLSVDTHNAIVQREDFDASNPNGPVRTGDVWVFDAITGHLKMQLKFPQGGNIYVFEIDTLHFYFNYDSSNTWIKVALTREPQIKGGIFNPSGNTTLSIKAKPSVTFTSADTLIGLTATIRWKSDSPLTLGTVSSPLYGFTKLDTVTTVSGYKYQKFRTTSHVALNWVAGSEYELFTVPVNGSSGAEDFELTNALSGGEWFVDINYLDKTDSVFYQPSAHGFAYWNKSDSWASTYENSGRHLAMTSTTLHEAYSSGGEIVYRRKNLSGAWEITKRISPGNASNGNSCICRSNGNYVHVVWQRQIGTTTFALWYNRSTDGGTTWGTASVLVDSIGVNSNQFEIFPVIAEYNSNQLVVAWCWGRSDSTGMNFKTSSNGGINWSATQRVTAMRVNGISGIVWFPSLSTGSNFLILTFDGRNSGVFSRIYNGSWQSQYSVNSGTGTHADRYSSVAWNSSNTLATWCAQTYSFNEYVIMFRSGYINGTWGSGFTQFARDAVGVSDFYPSITYAPRGATGIDIIYHNTATQIRVNMGINGSWNSPLTISSSGQWANTTMNTPYLQPIRTWTDQSSSPYEVKLQSEGNYNLQKVEPEVNAEFHRRIVLQSDGTGSSVWFDLAPLKVVTATNDTVLVPFKTLDMTQPFTATMTEAWDYLGTDQVTLPANAKSLIVNTDIKSFVLPDTARSKGENVFTTHAFRIDVIKNGQAVTVSSDRDGISGTKSISVSQYAGQTISIRSVGTIPAEEVDKVTIGIGDVYTRNK
jgi:hypothetical protein